MNLALQYNLIKIQVPRTKSIFSEPLHRRTWVEVGGFDAEGSVVVGRAGKEASCR